MATAAEQLRSRLSELRGGWKPEDYSAKLLIPEERLMVASDVHLPYYDEALFARMLEHCQRGHIQALVFSGDLMDIPTFSHWGQTDYSTQFTRELEMLRGVVEISLSVVDVVYWSLGNHEVRWLRKLDNQVCLEHLARMAGLGGYVDDGRLILSDNPSLEAFGGSWIITHPSQYSKVPLDVPSQLARKYRKNVMCGHSHHWGMGAYENFTVVETGGLFKPEYTRYVQYNVTTLRYWVQGYWTLVDGIAVGYR